MHKTSSAIKSFLFDQMFDFHLKNTSMYMNTHNTRLNKKKNARRGNRSRESAIDEERGPTIGKYRGRRLRIARPKSREFFI